MPCFIVRSSQYRRWMHRRHHERSQGRLQKFAAVLSHAKIAPQQSLCRGSAQAYDHLRVQRRNFRIQPLPAAAISTAFGFLWMRRFPRGSHLKCFTALVTYTFVRSIPASSSAVSSSLPAVLQTACLRYLPDSRVARRPASPSHVGCPRQTQFAFRASTGRKPCSSSPPSSIRPASRSKETVSFPGQQVCGT